MKANCMRPAVRALMFSALLAIAMPAAAERPSATKILPKDTVAFVHVPNARELADKYNNTNFGRMLQDPQLKPLIDEVYGALGELVAQVKEQVGLTLPEMVALNQGELTFAVVAPPEAPLALVAWIDAGENLYNARTLVEKGIAAIERQGAAKREETVGDVKMTVFDNVGPRGRRSLVLFEKDTTVVAATDINVAKAYWRPGAARRSKTLSRRTPISPRS